jgi:hypothetical protein
MAHDRVPAAPPQVDVGSSAGFWRRQPGAQRFGCSAWLRKFRMDSSRDRSAQVVRSRSFRMVLKSAIGFSLKGASTRNASAGRDGENRLTPINQKFLIVPSQRVRDWDGRINNRKNGHAWCSEPASTPVGANTPTASSPGHQCRSRPVCLFQS